MVKVKEKCFAVNVVNLNFLFQSKTQDHFFQNEVIFNIRRFRFHVT